MQKLNSEIYNILKQFPYQVKKLFSKYYSDLFFKFEVDVLNKKYNPETPAKTKPNNILFINSLVGRGGAAKIAYDSLCVPLKSISYNTNILTSKNHYPENANIIEFIEHCSKERKFLSKVEKKNNLLDFYQHESLKIKELKVFKDCDVIHLNNLHGNFFNPYILPQLTALKPTIWTLHDYHAFTGYCTVKYKCEKWQSGCLQCPHLLELGLKDTANYIWKIKKQIYQNSEITIVCPSTWLKEKAEKSILNHFEIKLINHGIDTDKFKNYGKEKSRKELNLPVNKQILLFSSDFGKENPNKGGVYLKKVYEYFKDREDILFLIIGGDENSQLDNNIINISYIFDETEMAKYYSAADLFIYPSLADSFGLVVAEAMACKLPIITFATGGIPEIMQHVEHGYIAEQKNSEDFIKGIELFIENIDLKIKAGSMARENIEKNFTIDKMINDYTRLYDEVFEKRKKVTE